MNQACCAVLCCVQNNPQRNMNVINMSPIYLHHFIILLNFQKQKKFFYSDLIDEKIKACKINKLMIHTNESTTTSKFNLKSSKSPFVLVPIGNKNLMLLLLLIFLVFLFNLISNFQ